MPSAPADPVARDTAPTDEPDRTSTASRRGAFLAAASGLALATSACRGDDTKPTSSIITPTPAPTPSRTPTPAGAAGAAPAGASGTLRLPKDIDVAHLVRRVTFASTPDLVAEVKKFGAQAWLEGQLNPDKVTDRGGAAVVKALPNAVLTIEQGAKVPKKDVTRMVIDLGAAQLGRAAFSSRQVYEMVVDFWNNHLYVSAKVGKQKIARPDYDLVIRRHAFGRFADMLQGSAEHPAMLQYLNGQDNTLKNPNENFAREVMELHTLGVGGGYTEKDVKQAALLLTGWKPDRADNMKMSFVPRRHYVGPVTVMGHKFANPSAEDGVAAMREFYAFLAHHPSTAKRIAHELSIRFVSDDPPSSLVDRLAEVYLSSDTEILPVLRELFSSPEFAAAGSKKVRKPVEYAVAVLRLLSTGPDDGDLASGLRNLRSQVQTNMPFFWLTPDGYPDQADAWQAAGVGLERLNTVARLLNGQVKGLGVPAWNSLVPASVKDATALTAALTQRIHRRAPTAQETKAVEVLFKEQSVATTFKGENDRRAATYAVANLLLSAPELLVR
jgi:uncharacterized protein (DUF1800 family)